MSSDNSQKTPIVHSLNDMARKRALDQIQLTGKNLPASVVSVAGSIVTVKFEIASGVFTLPKVTIPLFGPEYIRYPMQAGDKGVVLAMDARIGAMSGLGGGMATLDQPANLSALVFLPIANTEWASVDPQSVVVRGPNGVVLMDEASGSVFTLTPTSVTIQSAGSITLLCGTSKLQLTPTSYLIQGSTGEITDGVNATSATIMNTVWSVLEAFLNGHVHSNGNGGANTGVAVTPYEGGSIAPGA